MSEAPPPQETPTVSPEPVDPPRRHSVLGKILVRTTALLAVLLSGFVGTLAMGQRSMIYHPRTEPPNTQLPPDGLRLFFQTEDGRQAAIYLPPPGQPVTSPPTTLWVLCSGNASLGRDWLGYIQEDVRKDGAKAAILLVDYPGYGLCEGKPTEASIQRTMDAVLDALVADRGWKPEDVRRDLRVLGFSLGSGAALKLAAREPVREILLLAPFSSLRDAAKSAVGPLLARLVIDHFDNKSRIRELAARTPPPRLTLFHGTRDTVVPHSHSEELARLFGPAAQLVLIPDADHTLSGVPQWKDITARLQGR
jgi:pimeloyl-ACP methyl ester carboxylesterase